MRPLLGAVLATFLLIPDISDAQTQDWAAVRALPRETRVIVRELRGHGRHVGHVRGRLLIATDSEITVLRSGRPLVIPRDMVGRIYRVRRDPVWEGFAIGVLYWLLARATIAGEACVANPEPGCTLGGVVIYGGIGALADFTSDEERLVYRAPKGATIPPAKPTLTLLRFSF